MITITIEGPPQSGKSSLANAIAQALILKGKHVIVRDESKKIASGCDILIKVEVTK